MTMKCHDPWRSIGKYNQYFMSDYYGGTGNAYAWAVYSKDDQTDYKTPFGPSYNGNSISTLPFITVQL